MCADVWLRNTLTQRTKSPSLAGRQATGEAEVVSAGVDRPSSMTAGHPTGKWAAAAGLTGRKSKRKSRPTRGFQHLVVLIVFAGHPEIQTLDQAVPKLLVDYLAGRSFLALRSFWLPDLVMPVLFSEQVLQ